jgi:hypothetical protein
LDIPNLLADVESDQFYIVLNVVRTVMLSPPPVYRPPMKTEDSMKDSMKDTKDGKDGKDGKPKRRELRRAKYAQPLDINSKPGQVS